MRKEKKRKKEKQKRFTEKNSDAGKYQHFTNRDALCQGVQLQMKNMNT